MVTVFQRRCKFYFVLEIILCVCVGLSVCMCHHVSGPEDAWWTCQIHGNWITGNWRYLMGFWERNHDPLQEQKELYTLNHHLSSCTPILNLLICTTFLDWVVFSHYSMFLIILSSLGKIPLLYFLKGKNPHFSCVGINISLLCSLI